MTRFVYLHTAEASLVLECRDGAPPLWRHFGARVDPAGLHPLAEGRTGASFSLDTDVPLSLAPQGGLGWFGPPMLSLRRDGKALLAAFDACVVVDDTDRIEVTQTDSVAQIELRQTLRSEPGGAFTFESTLRNTGETPIEVDWLASALLPVADNAETLVTWRGRHNAELVEVREAVPQYGWSREGRRGIPGHGGPPAVVVLSEGATRDTGLVHALQLAWSGDTRIAVERDDEGCWQLCAGAVPQPGEVVLGPGDAHAAPPAIVAISTAGSNGASGQHHAAVRARMAWPGGAMRPRPVHLNTWEAAYFDHDDARMIALAEAAAELGIERFVLDDGWFAGRRDDTAGLGDWTPDPIKYPGGLGPLAATVVALGMEFGLWVEPEMVNPDSDLYRAHPDWVLAAEGRERLTARNQLVLDLSRGEVRDHLFGVLDKLLTVLPISYLKWDHNRDLAPAGGARQVFGLYDLLTRLRAANPDVEIESCAGGGGRSDAGIAAFAHRFWASDNVDAVSRVAIQRGFLAFLPPETMGAHVGASPAHATGRTQSLGFRAAVALPGHFGVECDPRRLSDVDRAELADWIAFYKHWRGLLHGGRVWQGEGADGLLWQAQGRDDDCLLFVIRRDPPADRRPQPLRLPFLDGDAHYTLTLLRVAGTSTPLPADEPRRLSGSWLANAGVPLPPLGAESVAIYHVRRAA